MRISRTVLLLVPLWVVGCGGGETLDGSSDASLKASTTKIEQSLDPAKRAKFHRAISALIFKYGDTPPADEAKARHDTFDGKTADQIITAGTGAEATLSPEYKEMLNKVAPPG